MVVLNWFICTNLLFITSLKDSVAWQTFPDSSYLNFSNIHPSRALASFYYCTKWQQASSLPTHFSSSRSVGINSQFPELISSFSVSFANICFLPRWDFLRKPGSSPFQTTEHSYFITSHFVQEISRYSISEICIYKERAISLFLLLSISAIQNPSSEKTKEGPSITEPRVYNKHKLDVSLLRQLQWNAQQLWFTFCNKSNKIYRMATNHGCVHYIKSRQMTLCVGLWEHFWSALTP